MPGIPGNSYYGNNITGKQNLLMTSLTKFYSNNNIQEILSILNGKSKTSLRIIDWFVTNYAKKNNIVYYLKSPNYKDKEESELKKSKKKFKKHKSGSKSYEMVPPSSNGYMQFIVYLNYKSQLKAYSKKQFDPFCRRDRIQFYYDKDNFIITTVGQLNFFRWALEHNVLEYIKNNIKVIEEDMNSNIRKSLKDSVISKKMSPKNLKTIHSENLTKKDRKKRKELSVSATKTLNKHSINVVVAFD